MKKIILSLMFLMIVFAGFANAALQAVGPVNPTTGFPEWYQDTNGLALELMEAADGFGLSAPVVPGNALSQTTGFGAEGFWYIAESSTTGTTGESTLLVMAVEAAYAGEIPTEGEQSAFMRIRTDAKGVTPGATYTFTHPYGTTSDIANAAGEVKITSDIGCFALGTGISSCDPNVPPGNPSNFGLALQGLIGPFLTWDTFNLNPALTDPALVNAANPTARYIGNPNTPHIVTGSPLGQNFFRIEGPNIGGPGINVVETNLFAVGGRIAVIDSIPPAFGATSTVPAITTVDGVNIAANAIITDTLETAVPLVGTGSGAGGVTSATIDLGPLGNTLTSTINGVQAGTVSLGTGTGTFTIDTITNTLNFNIAFSGLTGVETVAHIHGPDGLGNPDSVLFPLSLGSPKIGTWTYPETSEADILAGRTYVNIHTNSNPLGEIRGQILPTANIQPMTRVAGTPISGTWFVNIPGPLTRTGVFNLPMTATDGSFVTTGNFVLTVLSPLASVSVTPATATIIDGNTQQLTANPIDQTGNAFVGATTTIWSSSNTSIATVDANGLVTAVAPLNPTTPGTATITASTTGAGTTVTGTSLITVTPIPELTSVQVTPPISSIAVGSTQQLTASVLDQFGLAFAGVTPTWTSSDNLIATVDANGLVTAVGGGTATITATATSGLVSVTGTSTITSVPPVLTSVGITPVTASVVVGNTQQLTALALDQFGANFTGSTITWSSSDNLIATVDANGLVTAVAPLNPTTPGTATITATATSGLVSVTGTSTITVTPVPILTSVSVSQPSASVVTGGTKQLTASALDQFGANFTGSTITWSSSDNLIATVDANGLVTAVAPGTTVLTITANDNAIPTPIQVTNTIPITVADLASITTPATLFVTAGKTNQLDTSAFDLLGNVLEGETSSWISNDTTIATIDPLTGLVTGVSVGTATITATSGVFTSNTSVIVSRVDSNFKCELEIEDDFGNVQSNPPIYTGHGIVRFRGDDNISRVQFEHNFSALSDLNLSGIKIIEDENGGTGSIVINGLANKTKTAFMNNKKNTGNVCVKDSEIESINNISSGCNAADETIVVCDGSVQNGYVCINNGAKYQISGLKNSAVTEFTPAPAPAPTGSSSGGGGGGGGGSSSSRTSGGSSILIPEQSNNNEVVGTSDTNNEEPVDLTESTDSDEQGRSGLSGITGAVIGALGSSKNIIIGVFIALVVIASVVILIRKS